MSQLPFCDVELDEEGEQHFFHTKLPMLLTGIDIASGKDPFGGIKSSIPAVGGILPLKFRKE